MISPLGLLGAASVFRRDDGAFAAVEDNRTYAPWDEAPIFNNDDVPVDLGGAQQRRQTAALSCHLIPNKLKTTRLPSARSASTFGHHSTFAQAVRFLPFSHLPANFCHFAGTSPLRTPTVRCKRPPSPAPCELSDGSSFIDGATSSSLAELSLLPRGVWRLCCFLPCGPR